MFVEWTVVYQSHSNEIPQACLQLSAIHGGGRSPYTQAERKRITAEAESHTAGDAETEEAEAEECSAANDEVEGVPPAQV